MISAVVGVRVVELFSLASLVGLLLGGLLAYYGCKRRRRKEDPDALWKCLDEVAKGWGKK